MLDVPKIRMDFRAVHPLLPTWMAALNDKLASLFDGEHASLYHASTAIVSSRGKRLRPGMVMLSCAAFGEVNDRAVTQAALIELIHTASLVHDDIVDKADSRRGAPSAPARWGNTFSVLLGDYLFARVFELATKDADPTVLSLLAAAATEMSRAVTLEYSGLDLHATEDTYLHVIQGKTAELFASAAAIGALVGGASPDAQATMRAVGRSFGCAFQLADDLYDLQGSEEETGKPVKADWHQRRATLPMIHALRVCSPEVAETIRRLWHENPYTEKHQAALHTLVEAAGGFSYSWGQVKTYREDALRLLGEIPPSAGRDALTLLCDEAFPAPILPS
ncbi:MAG: polyprenyl synthetase family protein [Armatimonadota bacterium]